MLYVLDSQKINRQGDARPLCSLLLIKAKFIENFFLEHYNLKICPSSLNVTMMQSVAVLLLVYWHPFFILSSSQLTPLLRKLSWPHFFEKTCLYAQAFLLFSLSSFPHTAPRPGILSKLPHTSPVLHYLSSFPSAPRVPRKFP